MDSVTLALAKGYVDKSISEAGLKGAPCTIKSTEVVDEGLKIVFEWEDSEGAKHTTTSIVPKGPAGAQGAQGP